MPATIQQIVSDPDFAKLPPADQASVVAHFDSDFSSVPDAEKGTVIQTLQRQAVSRPDLAPPPGVQRPSGPNMQMSGLGTLVGSPDTSPPVSKVPPSIQQAPDSLGVAIGGATLAGLAAMTPGVSRVATGAVKMAPYVAASEAINYIRRELPGGKYIPAYAELLPWFMGGKGAAAEGEAAAPKNAGDPFRNVPDPEADVFNVKQPSPAAPPMPAAAAEATAARSGSGVQNAPYTYTGESALRQILTGLGNKELLQVARSRGIDVAAEAQLKPGLGDSRLIKKIIGDFSPDELDEIRSKYIETNRMGRPVGISPEADNVATVQTYFPELKIPQTKLNRARQSFAARPGGYTLYDMLAGGKGN